MLKFIYNEKIQIKTMRFSDYQIGKDSNKDSHSWGRATFISNYWQNKLVWTFWN